LLDCHNLPPEILIFRITLILSSCLRCFHNEKAASSITGRSSLSCPYNLCLDFHRCPGFEFDRKTRPGYKLIATEAPAEGELEIAYSEEEIAGKQMYIDINISF